MSDSESDTSNVFTFQNATTVSAKGPNTNITNLSFRHPMSSTMFMPRNFERQRYAESAYDQRSRYYRRETSPMSIHSACDVRPRNFQQYYPGMSSQRSVFNGRSGSPMSVRSIDSSASVSAADIAFAFKNVKFNKHDIKVIKDAYHKLMKQKVRKRIERRRNMRLFLKGRRQGSGEDSGEQGSNSSVSSDDCNSIKTSYKENISSNRSTRIDLKSFRGCNMVKDCSENFRQNSFRNKFSVGSNINHLAFNNTLASKQVKPMPVQKPVPVQKDRFRNKSGFLPLSQRFNQSIASSAIMENTEKPPKVTQNNMMNNVKNHYSQNNNNNCPSTSEDEEIFSEMTVREKSTYNVESQGKRSLDSEDETNLPERKKSRIVSPIKNAPNAKKASLKPSIAPCQTSVEMSNSFEFAKPLLPVRKSRPKVQEKLIAKSHTTPLQSLNDFVEPIPQTQNNLPSFQPSKVQEKPSENVTQLDQSETSQISDISSRPSFIKRKLFTQKMDVAEKANLSNDGTNSPQASVYSLQKEKNKTRKLVTNQSCLNRDVQEDNNLLDLIHKIVPPDQINMTNQTTMNQTKMIDVTTKSKQNNEDKWDVTSVISMCNDDDVSDTFTDEEIFKADNTKDAEKNKNTNIKSKQKDKDVNIHVDNATVPRDCKIVLEKIQYNNTFQKQVVNQNFNLTHNNVTQPSMQSSVKGFWDTDFESDAECHTAMPRNKQISNLKTATATFNTTKQDFISTKGYEKNAFKKPQNVLELPKHLNNTSLNNTVMNNTISSMCKFNVSTLSLKSHRTSKKKKCCNETLTNEIKSNLDYPTKFSPDKTKHSKKVEKTIEKVNPKPNTQSKFSTETPKPKSNKQNEKHTSIGKSANQSKKSPKEKTSRANKVKNVTPNKSSSKKLESLTKSSRGRKKDSKTVGKNLEKVDPKPNTQSKSFTETPKPKLNKQNEKHTSRGKSANQSKKSPKVNKTTANKNKKVTPSKSTSKKLESPTKFSQDNKKDSKTRTRPVRSCRTPSQNRSIEVSQSSLLNNTSIGGHRSLRSRVVDLSSSIDTTIKIKPKNKIINNKNISYMNKRQSNVSFSLGSEKQTPTPKKNFARNRADFFKGKRKT